MSLKNYVVYLGSNGAVEKHRLKAWIRNHPEELSAGLDPNNMTAPQMWSNLQRLGWKVNAYDSVRFIIKKDASSKYDYASTLIDSLVADDDDEEVDEIEEAEEITFGLERDLQNALRRNIEQIELGLEIVDDGKERTVEAGRIDILAKDKNGRFVVIELKAGTATPEVIAQITSYMACIDDPQKRGVRGILIAGDFHKRVMLSSQVIPLLELRRYTFRFAFEKIG